MMGHSVTDTDSKLITEVRHRLGEAAARPLHVMVEMCERRAIGSTGRARVIKRAREQAAIASDGRKAWMAAIGSTAHADLTRRAREQAVV